MRLATGRLAKQQSCIQPCGRVYDVVKTLGALVELFGLDPRFCVFGSATARSNGRPQPSIQPYAQPSDQAHAVMEEPPSALAYNNRVTRALRSEEHTSELPLLMQISCHVLCLINKTIRLRYQNTQ